MCKDLEEELTRGDNAAIALAKHLIAMGAAQVLQTINIEGSGRIVVFAAALPVIENEMESALQAAAQVWTDPETSGIEMDARLAKAIAWTKTAAQYASNADYYRGQLEQVGKLLGPSIFIAEDGSIQDKPIIENVPSRVRLLAEDAAKAMANSQESIGPETPLFMATELAYMLSHPEAVQSAIDYHDMQATMGEPMGYDCSFHNDRIKVLKARKAALIEAIDAC